ncbi:sodium/proline symporter PutP [Lentisphaerota bacterium WC36G]|nr:sodium/proline symporter PutP [Lentisphaerae bacterium WC36]
MIEINSLKLFNNFSAVILSNQHKPIIVTFCLYLIVMLAIGLYFLKKSNNLEGYLLGGRSMGSWVTALSTQASDMSGWLLMGLPGAVFVGGVSESWAGIGLFIGTFLNWLIVAPRLRVYTEQSGSLTISTFFERRFIDKYRLTQISSALIILFFFTIYVASGLVLAGKLFHSLLGVKYNSAVLAGALVLVMYTLLGGFLAVCWTDLIQGLLMFVALLIIPILAYFTLKDGELITVAQAKNISLNIMEFTNKEGNFQTLSVLAICSSLAWGLGYFGMPHVIVRFMSIKSHRDFPKAMSIAMVWVFISLFCSIVIGVLGIALYKTAPNGDKEQVFIQMIRDLANPWIGGVLMAAILAAIMSTVDSQLLVCSSSLTEDIYAVAKKKAKDKELLWVSRLCVFIVAIIAMLLAFSYDKEGANTGGTEKSILKLVSFAWAGFGAAFGPVIIRSLYSKKTTWYSALSGMVIGGVTVVVWYQIREYLSGEEFENCATLREIFSVYELLPAFILNFVVMIIIDFIAPQQNNAILKGFDQMIKTVQNKEIEEDNSTKNC